MAFVIEDVAEDGPAGLVEEHQTLVAWIKASRAGHIEYLRSRMVDPDLPAALYYIEGIGMGDGQRFALVRGTAIYLVSVCRVAGKPAAGSPAARVLEVSLPEGAPMNRGSIQSLISVALRDYYEAHSYMMHAALWITADAAAFDWSGARWVVRPRKYSLLYWSIECSKGWRELRTRRWPQFMRTMTSPLAAASTLAAFAWQGLGWPVALAGAWLSLRMLQYETELRLGHWVIGQVKYRHPLGFSVALARLTQPVPLAVLKVQVEPVAGRPMMRTVRIVNRSWVPVPYVSIGAHSLAKLLAPGLVEQLRQRAKQSGSDPQALDRDFPPMVKKWLMPGQSFARNHHLQADFPISMQSPQVEAIVTVPRFVSGEPRRGPTSFLLEVQNISY